MADPFLGEIYLVGFSFNPVGWALCAGQLMSIAENSALFALIGTTYGGDGQNTFGLPDLRGRMAIHQGQGAGLSSYVMGEQGGSESVTLITNQLPIHGHNSVSCVTETQNTSSPSGAFFAAAADNRYGALAPTAPMGAGTIANSGGSQAHENRQPFLVMNWIIALAGIFPSRN